MEAPPRVERRHFGKSFSLNKISFFRRYSGAAALENFMETSISERIAERISELPAVAVELLELGSVLGQNQAFGLVAGRCSAAQAASLKRLRDEKKYKQVTEDWRDFCWRYLRMSGSQADKIIHLWEEFGEGFFKVAQLTRISPATYRAIAPAVREDALHLNGEVIELRPENSRQVAQAVARHRRVNVKQPARPLETYERLREIENQCMDMVADLQEVAFMDRTGPDWGYFKGVVSRSCRAMNALLVDFGID